MKRCSKCGDDKAECEFNKNRRRPDGLKNWYLANRGHHIAKVRQNNLRYKLRNTRLVKRYLATHYRVDCGECDTLLSMAQKSKLATAHFGNHTSTINSVNGDSIAFYLLPPPSPPPCAAKRTTTC
jgi:hypothetical protein